MIIPEGFHIRMNLIFWFVDGAEQNGKIVKYWSKMKIMTINILEVKMKGKKCWKCKYWTKYFDSNRYFCKRGYCKN